LSLRRTLRERPGAVDLFLALRELERSAPAKPRIGDAAVRAETVVELDEEPFLAFPDSNVAAFEDRSGAIPRLVSRFLGYFGPQGALPLGTTAEAYQWASHNDPSFARFVDIFGHRFRELFFRAWADARPVAQHDRPDSDRFFRYVASFAGIGVASLAERDSVADIAKLPFAGLVSSAVRSASRLRQLIRGVLGADVEIEERIGSWLIFEPEDRLRLGQPGSALGGGAALGSRSYSINDKLRIVIRTRSLAEYRGFLPGQANANRLADLVFFYIGHRLEFDVKLALPAAAAPAARLGVSGELGWTAWIAPAGRAGSGAWLDDARFDIERRRRAEREARREGRPEEGRP
jgi:type VI secretion system protein ImpH